MTIFSQDLQRWNPFLLVLWQWMVVSSYFRIPESLPLWLWPSIFIQNFADVTRTRSKGNQTDFDKVITDLTGPSGTPSTTVMELQYIWSRDWLFATLKTREITTTKKGVQDYLLERSNDTLRWDDSWRIFVRRRRRGPSMCLWLRVWIQKWLWLNFCVIWRDTEGIRFFLCILSSHYFYLFSSHLFFIFYLQNLYRQIVNVLH